MRILLNPEVTINFNKFISEKVEILYSKTSDIPETPFCLGNSFLSEENNEGETKQGII